MLLWSASVLQKHVTEETSHYWIIGLLLLQLLLPKQTGEREHLAPLLSLVDNSEVHYLVHWVVVTPAFNPSTWEAEAGGYL